MQNNNTEDNKEIEGQTGDINQNSQDANQDQSKKTKEDNFDGLQKKYNAREKEVKRLTSQLQELQDQINAKTNDASKTEKSELAELKSMIEELKTQKEQETIQNKVQNSLSKANIDKKFEKVSLNLLNEIATDNSLDLKNQNDLTEAVKLLTDAYPEFVVKKAKEIGIPNGQTSGSATGLNVLDGDMEKYFSLSPEKKAELKRKVYQD